MSNDWREQEEMHESDAKTVHFIDLMAFIQRYQDMGSSTFLDLFCSSCSRGPLQFQQGKKSENGRETAQRKYIYSRQDISSTRQRQDSKLEGFRLKQRKQASSSGVPV